MAQKKEYFGFLPAFGWEVKLVHTFYAFYWLQGHKKRIESTLNHDSTQNILDTTRLFFYKNNFIRTKALLSAQN